MTNNQYITALKKALSGLDKQSRSDIVQEIQSHAAESGTPLLERFGPPVELAKQYLDGEIIVKPVSKKILGIGKKIFVWLGLTVLVIIAAIALFIWQMSGDDFDYSDEGAAELSSKQADWVTKEWTEPLNVKLDQASAVFYWHDAQAVRWSCLGNSQPTLQKEGAVLDVSRAKCMFYLPKTVTSISADQSQVVLVRPQVSLELSIEQANLRVAENGVKYRYVVDANRSKVVDLLSHDDAELTISIKSNEASISKYEEN